MLYSNLWQDKYLNTEGKAMMMGARNTPPQTPLQEFKPGTYCRETLQEEEQLWEMNQSDCLIKHCVASQGCSQISGPCLLHRLAPAAPAIHSTLHSLGEQKLPSSRTDTVVFTHHLSTSLTSFWKDLLLPMQRDSCSYLHSHWTEMSHSLASPLMPSEAHAATLGWLAEMNPSPGARQTHKATSKHPNEGAQTPLPLLHILCTVSTAVSRSGSPLPHSTHARTHCGQGLLLASRMPGNTWLKGKKGWAVVAGLSQGTIPTIDLLNCGCLWIFLMKILTD